MNNPVLEDIVDYAKKRLVATYGYCGVASGDKTAYLNSGDDALSVTIQINEAKEEGAEG